MVGGKTNRNNHDESQAPPPEFKVGLQALNGLKTRQQIAKEYQVHPVQVSDWKKVIVESAVGAFEKGSAALCAQEFESERTALNAILEGLTVQTDSLKKIHAAWPLKGRRSDLAEKDPPRLSLRTQFRLLTVCRSSFDHEPVSADPEDLKLMRIMDEIDLEDPCMGTRCLKIRLRRDHGVLVNRKRLQRRVMGLETIGSRPASTSRPDQRHRKYPYLLRDLEIADPDQAYDISSVPMPCGNAYLCAAMD